MKGEKGGGVGGKDRDRDSHQHRHRQAQPYNAFAYSCPCLCLSVRVRVLRYACVPARVIVGARGGCFSACVQGWPRRGAARTGAS